MITPPFVKVRHFVSVRFFIGQGLRVYVKLYLYYSGQGHWYFVSNVLVKNKWVKGKLPGG